MALFFIFSSSQALFAQNSESQVILTEVASHLARRDYAAALALFDKLPKEDADKIEIKIMQASICNSAGKTADSKRIANAIIASENNNTDALMILADAAAIENKERDRRGFLDRIIRIDPGHVRALIDLGNINLRNQNLRSAATYFDRALAVDADNGEALVSRAAVYRYAREARNAERLLNRAVSLYPDWARPFHERARLYKGAGYNNDALTDLNAALKLEPDNYWALVDRGELFMSANRKEEALTDFNRAIASDPAIFMAYIYSAALKDEAGDYEGAEKDYIILARLKPDYYFAFEAIGVLRMRKKQWAGARDAFLEAYKQAPKEFTYALLAAGNWMRAGRQTDPKQYLAQVLRTATRDTIEYAMLRLYHDLSGDSSVTILVENEKNVYKKTQMLFYLASYYDIRGNKNLADRYYLMVKDMNAPGTIEWQLNEMMIKERGLEAKAENK